MQHLNIFACIIIIKQLDHSVNDCCLHARQCFIFPSWMTLCALEPPIYLSRLFFPLILISLKRNASQMLPLFWHMISNDAKWPHGLMCPRVKQGCPDQPLTPGSFIRLCSRHGSIDKGQWKGHPLSLFASIQQSIRSWISSWCSLEH